MRVFVESLFDDAGGTAWLLHVLVVLNNAVDYLAGRFAHFAAHVFGWHWWFLLRNDNTGCCPLKPLLISGYILPFKVKSRLVPVSEIAAPASDAPIVPLNVKVAPPGVAFCGISNK